MLHKVLLAMVVAVVATPLAVGATAAEADETSGVSADPAHYPIVDPLHVVGGRTGGGSARVAADWIVPSHFDADGERYTLVRPVEARFDTDTHDLTLRLEELVLDVPDGDWAFRRSVRGTIEETSKVDGTTKVYPVHQQRFHGVNRGDHIHFVLDFDGSNMDVDFTLPKVGDGQPSEALYSIDSSELIWHATEQGPQLWRDSSAIAASGPPLAYGHRMELGGPAMYTVATDPGGELQHEGTLAIAELIISGGEVITISGGLAESYEHPGIFEGVSIGWADIDPTSAAITIDETLAMTLEFELMNDRYDPVQRYSWQRYDGDSIRVHLEPPKIFRSDLDMALGDVADSSAVG